MIQKIHPVELVHKEYRAYTQSKNKQVDKIIALLEKKAFIYYDGGSFEVYDFNQKTIIQGGQITTDVKYFYQIYPKTLLFLDPEDLKVKLIDLENGQINPKFTFQSSSVVTENSDKEQKETVAVQFRMYSPKVKEIKYLITQDLEKQYSNNNVCHFKIYTCPNKYQWDIDFNSDSYISYDYINKTSQTELYSWQVDEETLVIFGQDSELGNTEFLLIKPHLGEDAFHVIRIKDEISFTLINVTNWYEPNKIAIWQNNNDGNAKPTIFTMDRSEYYDGQNWIEKKYYQHIKVFDDYVGDEPNTFMDIFNFQLNQSLVLQFRLCGVEPRFSLIDYANLQNPEVISEYKMTDFFHDLPPDFSYLLSYNDLEVKDHCVEFYTLEQQRNQQLDYFQLLYIFEKSNLIEKYGVSAIEEMFEFYQ